MFRKYNIKDYVTTMKVERHDGEYCRAERKRYGTYRHELKSTVIKSYFFEGFFNNAGLSDEDMKYIIAGQSPVRRGGRGEERLLFTIHHIKPLNCGGETKPSNLIPLPRNFHKFIHEKIFDPQMADIPYGASKELVGVPDFSKITLEMMLDPAFRIQYHKYMVDVYKIIPPRLKHHKSKKTRANAFNQWYQHNFGSIK